jgi:chemotaxis signal transduction protein
MLNYKTTPDVPSADTLHVIRCNTAGEAYGLDMSWVRSIQRSDRLRRNPGHHRGEHAEPSGHSPSASRRGEHVEPSGYDPVGWLPADEGTVPVFSLADLLGRPSKKSNALQRVVVLNPSPFPSPVEESERETQTDGRGPWALLVDRVSQVIQVPADRIATLPPIVVNPSAAYFENVLKLDQELVLLLSPQGLHPQSPPSPLSSPSPVLQSPPSSLQSKASGRGQIVVFSTAEPQPGEQILSFGLSISQVPEILSPLPLTSVPAAPDFVLGLVNWRDRPVPVVDLTTRLGLAASRPPGQTRLIIARDRGLVPSSSPGETNTGTLVGFPVRPATRLLRLPIAHRLCRLSLPLDQSLTRGIVELENEVLVIPDVRTILWPGPKS